MRPYDLWWWAQFIADLDKAGYRIVKKPVLTEVGIPKRNP